jgi:hypothetical protein
MWGSINQALLPFRRLFSLNAKNLKLKEFYTQVWAGKPTTELLGP